MTVNDKGPYRVLEHRDVHRNYLVYVREDRVRRPSGSEATFSYVALRSGSTVLALTEDREVYLVSEYKYAIGRDSIELISGAIEPGEVPLAAAQRELQEEVGLAAGAWTDLGALDPFTAVVNSPNYLFLARDLQAVPRNPDDGEVLDILRVPLDDAVAMVMRGEITHGASCVLLLRVAHMLATRGVVDTPNRV